MKIDRAEIRLVSMPLRTAFETSFARETQKDCLLVRLFAEGIEGWGEVVAMEQPLYNEETLATCTHLLKDVLLPKLFRGDWETPDHWAGSVLLIRRNYMAKAGLEAALWDLYSQLQGRPLAQLWGGVRDKVEVGISLGIEPHLDLLLPQIEGAVSEGYTRVKLKIKPGWDVAVVAEVRQRYPKLKLQVDANSAYRLEDLEILKQLDGFELLLIEQPLDHDDIVDHAQLAKQLKTPICLDESIDSVEQCRRALDLGSASIINIKPGRVGGFSASRAIHDHCQSRSIPCWVGGMLETGIGRLQNLALASMSNFTLPGDLSASQRYFERDLIDPEVVLEKDGRVKVPTCIGLSQCIDWKAMERYTLSKELVRI
jgi:O-succinylbenzoate synthase